MSMRLLVNGWKAVQLFIAISDETADTVMSINQMIDAHTLRRDEAFHEAARKARLHATCANEAVKLISQKRPDEAMRYLGIEP